MFKRLGGVMMSVATFPVQLVVFPVMAVVAALHGLLIAFAGIVKNLGWIVVSPFIAASALLNSDEDDVYKWIPAVAGVVACVVGGIFLMVFGFSTSTSPNDIAVNDWLSAHRLFILLPIGTNVLSGLYEGGRAYFNYLTGASKSQSGTNEKNGMPPQSYLTMMSKIGEKDRLDLAEARSLFGEVAELVKNDKVNLKEADQLLKMIYRVAPAPAVVA